MNARAHAHPVRGFPKHCAKLRLISVEEDLFVPGDNLCFFHWIKILALQILLCPNRQHLFITDLAYNHGKQTQLAALSTDQSPCRATAMTIHQLYQSAPALRKIAMRADDQHALEAGFAHALCQILYIHIVERLSGLIRAILNLLVWQLLHLLARLRLSLDHLIDCEPRICLAAPADPCTTLAAH